MQIDMAQYLLVQRKRTLFECYMKDTNYVAFMHDVWRFIKKICWINNNIAICRAPYNTNTLLIHFFIFFKNTIFVSSRMYPENLEGTQVIVGSMNIGYIYDTARNRTHNLSQAGADPSRPQRWPLL